MNGVPVTPPITEYLYQKATMAGVPLSGTFELTPVCNMDCKMCYVRMSQREQNAIAPLKDAEDWISLGQRAANAGMLYLLLTGGEPFLRKDFRQILEGLHKLGLVISINSNGTMIDETVVQWLAKCPPSRINISIYGACDETYARLCGNPNGFSQVKKAIGLLKQAGIAVKLNCSLTMENAAELPQMVAFAKEQQLPIQIASYMFPAVRKDGKMVGKNHRLSPEEAAYYMAYGEYLTMGEKALSREDYVKDPDDPCTQVGEGVRCRAGRCSFWVTWQGELTPCGMFPSAGSPNVFRGDFSEAWEQVKKETAAIRLPKECAGCNVKDFCHACAAMVITESGCFDKVPTYRCQMIGAYPAEKKRLKEQLL